jgi:hypothetical protein
VQIISKSVLAKLVEVIFFFNNNNLTFVSIFLEQCSEDKACQQEVNENVEITDTDPNEADSTDADAAIHKLKNLLHNQQSADRHVMLAESNWPLAAVLRQILTPVKRDQIPDADEDSLEENDLDTDSETEESGEDGEHISKRSALVRGSMTRLGRSSSAKGYMTRLGRSSAKGYMTRLGRSSGGVATTSRGYMTRLGRGGVAAGSKGYMTRLGRSTQRGVMTRIGRHVRKSSAAMTRLGKRSTPLTMYDRFEEDPSWQQDHEEENLQRATKSAEIPAK